MQTEAKNKTSSKQQGLATIDDLYQAAVQHQTALDTVCRRISCLGRSAASERQGAKLEHHADIHLQKIARIALLMAKKPSTSHADVVKKAKVLWTFIHDEEPESVSEFLLRSLCRDLAESQ